MKREAGRGENKNGQMQTLHPTLHSTRFPLIGEEGREKNRSGQIQMLHPHSTLYTLPSSFYLLLLALLRAQIALNPHLRDLCPLLVCPIRVSFLHLEDRGQQVSRCSVAYLVGQGYGCIV